MSGGASSKARLLVEAATSEPQVAAMGGGRVALWSQPAPGGSGPNQDAALAAPLARGGALLAVCDGLGGEAAGERAAAIAVRRLAEAAPGRSPSGSRIAVLDALESADAEIQALGLGAATTAAVATVEGDEIRPFQVGDSLMLLVSERGELKWRSISHSPVGFAVEAGVLDESEALRHAELHVVSNVLGVAELWIEVGPRLPVQNGDTLLLASDGLADNLRLEEIVTELMAPELPAAVAALAERAARRMAAPAVGQPHKPDDLTLVAFRRPSDIVPPG